MDKADNVIKFIKNLRHVKAPFFGNKFILEDWQEAFLRKLYGTVDDNGKRQYRQALLFVPRKSGKTTLAAALGLYHTFAAGEKGGEVYTAAGSRDQAALVFNTARDMLRQNKQLMERAKIVDSRKNISNVRTGTFFRALAADSYTAYGLNASVIICDELGFWKTRDLYDALLTSTGARSEPLILNITTAGMDHHGIGHEVYDYACKVRDGAVTDNTFLPWIYEAGKDDPWDEEATWEKANPALGSFRNKDELQALCKKAKEVPALESAFRRLYLNQWVSAESTWIGIDKWDACAGTVDIEQLKDRPCYGGLDLSTTTDISSLCLVFPNEDDPPAYDVLSYSWLPESRAKSNPDRVPYDAWRRHGHLETTPGDVIDYRHIKNKILNLSKVFDIKEIGFDRWNASQLVSELLDEDAPMVEVGMGYASMSAPMKWLEELILSQRLNHGGNPVLRWAASNVVVEMDAAGNIKPSKTKSDLRIDPVVALVIALSRAQNREELSVYDKQSMLVL